MNAQLKNIFIQSKLNFLVLAAIVMIAILGKSTNPELTNAVFTAADQLVSDLYIVFIAISLGAFIPDFKLVTYGSIGIFIAAVICIQIGVFTYLSTVYLFAILIVVLGFASIANLYRRYQNFRL